MESLANLIQTILYTSVFFGVVFTTFVAVLGKKEL